MRNYMKVNWKSLIITAMCLFFIASGAVLAEEMSGGGSDDALLESVEVLELTDAEDVYDEGYAADANSVSIDLYDDLDGVTSIRSMSFREDTTIRRGLSALSQYFKKNIICSPDISGTVSMTNLYNVTFEEALRAIIGPNKYDIQDNFVRVYTPEEYQQDQSRFVSTVIKLYYITAAEAGNLITPLLSEYGAVATTTPAAMTTEAGEGGDSFALTDMLVVKDFPDNVNNIQDLLASIDVPPQQILIEVTMLEAKLTEATEFGVDLDALGASPVTTVSTSGDEGTSREGVSTSGFASEVSAGGLSIGIVSDHFRTFIRALEEITDVTVLANPKILALNKQAGSLLIGSREGYVTVTSVSDGGQATQEVAFLEVGTRLAFRPYICKNGLIRMEINPKQSEGETKEKGDFVLPEERTTEVLTNVMVEDGQTIVLAGLFKEKTDLVRSQVPLLGDIPFLGEIFKKVKDTSIRTELIILITPHIISRSADTEGAARMDDVNRFAHKARKDITWASRTRRAEDRYSEALRLYDSGDRIGALGHLNGMWEWNRSYLEVERLRERIIKETQPDYQMSIERIMLSQMEAEESKKWYRKLK